MHTDISCMNGDFVPDNVLLIHSTQVLLSGFMEKKYFVWNDNVDKNVIL